MSSTKEKQDQYHAYMGKDPQPAVTCTLVTLLSNNIDGNIKSKKKLPCKFNIAIFLYKLFG